MRPPPGAVRGERALAGEKGGAAPVAVRPSRPADDPARDAFVESRPEGSFFHLSGWRRVVERVMGHEPCDLLAFRGEELAGVLPLMRAPALFGRSSLLSMPFAVYGGPCAVSLEVERALVSAAVRQAEEERSGRLELRLMGERDFRLERSELYATFLADLPDDPALVLAGMPKKARAEARKARERFGLRLSEGAWYLDDLYRLFQENKRSLGSPGLPQGWFRGLRDELGARVRVHLVHRGREPLAVVMSFVWRDTLLAYYAGTADGADRAWSASNFMYMALREWAVERGLSRFDFGRSRRDSGAFRFKVHQGLEPAPLPYAFHLVRDRHLPRFTPSNPRTKILRDTWSRLPPALTRRLSARLAPYLG